MNDNILEHFISVTLNDKLLYLAWSSACTLALIAAACRSPGDRVGIAAGMATKGATGAAKGAMKAPEGAAAAQAKMAVMVICRQKVLA